MTRNRRRALIPATPTRPELRPFGVTSNALVDDLLHDASTVELVGPATVAPVGAAAPAAVPGGIEDAAAEAVLRAVNEWVREQGLPEGHIQHELAHPGTGDPLAILGLAWPNGLREGSSEPVARLLGEGQDILQIANHHGFRHFTSAEAFKRYAETEVLAVAGEGAAAGAR